VVLSTVVRLAVATTFDVPWITPDEMIYGLVGESLWETGELSVRGIAIPYLSLLTPALVGLPLTLDDLELGVALAQALQALAMSLAAVPVYLWTRRLAGRGWALTAATLALLPPALWYGGLLMTEALYYPLVTAALLGLARMLERPALERQGIFLLFVSLAAAVRLQALILLPALVLAIGLHAWFGRSTATVRRLSPILVLVGLASVALVTLYAAGRSDVLGAYGEIAESTPSSTGVLSQLTWHAGALVVMTLGLPLLATATLVVLATLYGEANPSLRAFLAVAAAYVVLLVGQVSVFAVGYLGHVSERYLVTALPPLLVGLCAWIGRGAPRPAAVVAPLAAASIVLVSTLPPSRVGTASSAHDGLTTLPYVRLTDPGETAFRLGFAAFAILAAAVFAFLPRRFLTTAVAVLALGFVATSTLAAREIDRFSALERAHDLGAADPRWVDAADVPGPVLLVDTGEQPSTAAARTTFWNRSVRRLLRLEGVPEQALPQQVFAIRRDGAIVDARTTAEISEPYAVLPVSMVVRGERLATSTATEIAPGSGLWRIEEPLRLVSRATGFTPVGDFRRAQVVVYRCAPGTLELTLLGKDGLPVRLTVNGFPWETVEIPANGAWRGTVRPLGFAIASAPCVIGLESEGLVGSTRVEWVEG
jgi:hypothetical protein